MLFFFNTQTNPTKQNCPTILANFKCPSRWHQLWIIHFQYFISLWAECSCPHNNHRLKPHPQCDGIAGRAFGGWLGHEGGALMNGIGALIKETLESPPLLSHGDRVTRQPPVRWDVGPQQTPSLPLPLSWTSQLLAVNNKFLSFKSHPSLWYFWHSSLNRLR